MYIHQATVCYDNDKNTAVTAVITVFTYIMTTTTIPISQLLSLFSRILWQRQQYRYRSCCHCFHVYYDNDNNTDIAAVVIVFTYIMTTTTIPISQLSSLFSRILWQRQQYRYRSCCHCFHVYYDNDNNTDIAAVVIVFTYIMTTTTIPISQLSSLFSRILLKCS